MALTPVPATEQTETIKAREAVLTKEAQAVEQEQLDLKVKATQTAPTPDPLEGVEIPSEWKGKPVKEIVTALLKDRTSATTAKTVLETEKKGLETRLMEVERRLHLTETKPAAEPQKPQMTRAELDAMYYDKPLDTVAMIVDQRINTALATYLQPFVESSLTEKAAIERDRAIAKFKDHGWKTFEAEVDTLMASAPLAQRAKRDAYIMAFRWLKMQRDEEVPPVSNEPVEDTGIETVGRTKPEPKASRPSLTSEERKAAVTYGMTEEEYAKEKEAMSHA